MIFAPAELASVERVIGATPTIVRPTEAPGAAISINLSKMRKTREIYLDAIRGFEGGEGLAESHSVELLSEFPPRKAGEVLSEIGKLDPTLAARLVSRLGGKATP